MRGEAAGSPRRAFYRLRANFSASPVRIFAIGIEGADGVTIKRLQGSDACELDRAAVFGRRRQHLGRREDGWQASLGGGDSSDQMRDGLAEGRQLGPIGQHDRLDKTAIPGHDATPATEPGFKPTQDGWFRETSRGFRKETASAG
jgi:hypothetical protein